VRWFRNQITSHLHPQRRGRCEHACSPQCYLVAYLTNALVLNRSEETATAGNAPQETRRYGFGAKQSRISEAMYRFLATGRLSVEFTCRAKWNEVLNLVDASRRRIAQAICLSTRTARCFTQLTVVRGHSPAVDCARVCPPAY